MTIKPLAIAVDVFKYEGVAYAVHLGKLWECEIVDGMARLLREVPHQSVAYPDIMTAYQRAKDAQD